MNKKKFILTAKDVNNLEIKALQQLKKSITNSFNDAVFQLSKCQSKVILCGVGKSGLIASKIRCITCLILSLNLKTKNDEHREKNCIDHRRKSRSRKGYGFKNGRKRTGCCDHLSQ